MGTLIGWLATTFVGEKFARLVAYVLIALGALAVIFSAKALYDHAVIAKHEQKVELKQVKRERTADANLQVNTGRQEAASQQRKEEIANATRNVPDQTPSARQHARACVELRRQAKVRRQSEPAC